MMSLRLAVEAADTFAAVGSIVGHVAATSECSAPVTPISVLFISGTEDPLVPLTAEKWRRAAVTAAP